MKKFFIIFFLVGFFAALPFFLHSLTTYASIGGACTNGYSGTCRDHNNPGSCGGRWDQGPNPYTGQWPCPADGPSIWCCEPTYTISGTVFSDSNGNGTQDGGEGGISGVTVSNTGGSPTTTDGNGNYSLPGLLSYPTTGYPYGISISNLPAGYNTTTANPVYLYLNNSNQTVNFGAMPPTPPTPTPGACQNNVAANTTIISTGVNVTASNVKNGDTATYGPQNTNNGVSDNLFWDSGASAPQWIEFDLGAAQTVSSIQVNVHTGTAGVVLHTDKIYVGTTPNPGTLIQPTSSCGVTDGQIINFPINQTNVRYVRLLTSASDANVAWNKISIYGSAPGTQTTTPGIIFSGDGSAAFGQGAASTMNWAVGGLTYPEVFKTYRPTASQTQNAKSVTSYQYVLNKAHTAQVTINDMSKLSGCSSLSNCSIPVNLPNGVYQANGNLTLNGYTFPAGKNYVFLINGDLTIMGSIIVSNGATAFFTSSHDIIVDKSVGTATNLFPLPAGQLQGIFSADRDFRIMGNNDCLVGKDKMINVEGAIVTNALGLGGNFRAQRDLCGDNPRYPYFTIRPRLDMLLNLPEMLMQRTTTFREDAP